MSSRGSIAFRPYAGPITPAEGASAAASWLAARRLSSTSSSTSGLRWHVEIALDAVDAPAPLEFDQKTATRFHIDIYAEEWGFFFCHAARSSWIRVTDIPFVHGRDDFGLLGAIPSLRDIGSLLRKLEQHHGVQLQRQHAAIRTNLTGAEPAIRRWITTL